MLKWYHDKKQLERILTNMGKIRVEMIDNKTLIIRPKQVAYREMQDKICSLERLITIDSIREPKIRELKEQFYEQYGDYGED